MIALVFVVHLVAAALPAHVWGAHHLAFFTPQAQLVAYALTGLLVLPITARFGVGLARLAASALASLPTAVNVYLPPVATALAGAAVFAALEVQHTLFGDNMARLAEVAADHAPEGPWYKRHRHDSVMRYYLHQLFREWLGWEASDSYAAISIGLGVIFLLAARGLAGILGRLPHERFLLFACPATSGFALVFCGYLEVYSSTVAAGTLYLWGTAAYASRRVGFWCPAICLALVGLSHVLGLFAAPALACAALYRWGWERHAPEIVGRHLLLWLTVASIVVGWTTFQIVRPSSAVPLLRPYGHIPYTLFAPSHLFEVINFQLLLQLPGWLCLALALPNSMRLLAGGSPKLAAPAIASDGALRPLLLGGTVTVVMMAVVNPALGRLDWDLMSMHGSVWVVMAAGVLLAQMRRYGVPAARRRWLVVVVTALGLFHTAPWILLQRFPGLAVSAVEAMTDTDPHRAGHRNMKLGVRFEDAGFVEAAIGQYIKAVAWAPSYFLAHYNLARALEKTAREEERALRHYERAHELKPDHPQTCNNLGGLYHRSGQLQKAISFYNVARKLSPGYAAAHSNVGLAYYEAGDFGASAAAYERAIELEPRLSHAYYNLSASHSKLGDLEATAATLEQFVDLEPTAVRGFLSLGNAYRMLGQRERAQKAYRRVLELAPNHAERRRILDYAAAR